MTEDQARQVSKDQSKTDVKLLWGGLRAECAIENHYCPGCKRTRKFRVAEDLKCLACGKRLQFRREGA